MRSLPFLALALALLMALSGCMDVCPESCDDYNPCTDDFCSSRTNYHCAHMRLDGAQGSCFGSVPGEQCQRYSCVAGSCMIQEQLGCVPDNGDDDDGSTTVTGEADWTFIVYLDADNNLESAGLIDFNEMEAAGSTDDVNILVQMDRIEESDYYLGYDSSNGDWADARRFYIVQDTDMDRMRKSELEALGEVNMGAGATLKEFLLWAVEEYPAKHYAVIIWDHGAGWDYSASGYEEYGMVAFDDTSGGDGITLAELGSALSAMKDKIGRKIDIIGFDACLNGMHEIDYEIADYAHIRIASEELVPGDGWDYRNSLSALVVNPGMSREELATTIVTDFERFYVLSGEDEMITLSAVDLGKVGTLSSAIDEFSATIAGRMSGQTATEVGRARAYVEEYGNDEYGFIDITDFAKIMHDVTQDPDIKASAKKVVEAHDDSIIAEIHGNGRSHSYGRSIYFPRTSSVYVSNYRTDSRFSTETAWDAFLRSYYTGQTADLSAPTVRGMSASSDTVSAESPMEITATVSGNQIADVQLEVYMEGDPEYGDYIVLLNYLPYSSPSFMLGDGSTIPFWLDGDNPLEIKWNGYGIAVEDDEGYLFIPLEPVERGSQYYFISGEYTQKGAISPVYASLVFDFDTGALEYVWDHENVMELQPNKGDRFSAYIYIIDFDEDDEYYVPWTELIYGETGFNLGYYPLPAGGYYLNLVAEDIAGNTQSDSIYITVGDYVETGYECYDGTIDGYCSYISPGYYCEAGELAYDEFCLESLTCMDGTPDGFCSFDYDGYMCTGGTLEYSSECLDSNFCYDGTPIGECSYFYNGYLCADGDFVLDEACYDEFYTDECSDGTMNGFCSNENPGYYCFFGELLDDPECVGSCPDGTPNEYCSFTMEGYSCYDGVLKADESCVESYGSETGCQDGTQHGYCSLLYDGYWCNNGELEYEDSCLAGDYGLDCPDGTEHGYCSDANPGYGCWDGFLEEYAECGAVLDYDCPDGTLSGYCSNPNPGYYCFYGELIEDEECIGSCADGTPNGYCSYSKDAYACWDGLLKPDDYCASSYDEDTDCQDGTEHGSCSNSNPGYFCWSGGLLEDEECIGSCEDGTPNGYCSYSKDAYACWGGALEPDEYCTGAFQ